MIGAGIGAVGGAIGGFMTPHDTYQERIVATVGGALIGGVIGGGMTSIMNYKPKLSSKSYISGGVGKRGANVKFGKRVKNNGSIPAGKIGSFTSGAVGGADVIMNSVNSRVGTTKRSSYYDSINKAKKTGNAASVHVAYVDSINHANRNGHTSALKRFGSDPYVQGKKLLSGKVQGLWK